MPKIMKLAINTKTRIVVSRSIASSLLKLRTRRDGPMLPSLQVILSELESTSGTLIIGLGLCSGFIFIDRDKRLVLWIMRTRHNAR